MIKFSNRELNILKRAKKFAKNKFDSYQAKIGGHGFDHAMRVTGMVAYLSEKENQPPFLSVLAALLHDIGRASNDPRSDSPLHGQLSREEANQFISSLGLTKEEVNLVKNAIEDHPFLNEKVRQSYVVKILMDADRLDGLGAMAHAKAAAHKWMLPLYSSNPKVSKDGEFDSIFGYFGVRVPEWGKMMWTKSGKKIAAQRLKNLKKFNEEFVEEVTFMQEYFDKLKI